jgi:phosphate transport system substrate-binding protein
MKKLLTIALSATLAIGVITPAHAETTVSGTGSSYVNNLMQNCKDGSVKVNYVASGSGAGKTQFASGTVDFGATDAPYITGDTKPDFPFGYIPIAGGPVALVYNIEGVRTLKLTNKIVSDIYLGKITKWNSKAIADINKGVKLPATRINPVYRGDSSGTSANFTTYLAQTLKGSGWVKDSTSFMLANKVVGTAGVKSVGLATVVRQTPNSIGYLDLGDAIAQNLSYAHLQNALGSFVKPTVVNSASFISAQGVTSEGLVKFDYNKKVVGGYNLSLVSYAIVSLRKSPNSTAVKTFFNYLVNSCVPANAVRLGYAPISNAVKVYARKTINLIGQECCSW